MKRLFSFVCLVLYFTIFTYSQQDVKLPGVVVEQNSAFNTGKVKYLANASIKAAGATPQLSDANGKFTLIFADQPVGNVARVYAKKNGYEVVNAEELKKAAVMGRLSPLKIVLCKEGQLYDNQVAYYKIAEDVAITSYKNSLAILKKQNRESKLLIAEMQIQYNEEITSFKEAEVILEKQKETAEAQAKELADRFVTINLDDQSPAYQRAFKAFLAKEIDQALSILDSVDLKRRLEINVAEIGKDSAIIIEKQESIKSKTEQIKQDVNQCVFKAQLHILKYEFEKAEELFELAIKYAPTDEKLIFDYAYYLQKQNRFSKAITYYDWVLKKYKQLSEKNPGVYLPDVAMTLNNLGILLSDNNEMVQAQEAYEGALLIYRQLSEKNPDVYLPDVAMTLNNLGVLLRANNEMVQAQEAYEEALLIRRQLSEKNPDVYLPDVAMTLNNLGILLSDNNEMVQAQEAYEEALLIYRQLSEKNPDVYLPDVATSLNNLGILLRANNEMVQAQEAYEEALLIRRQLSEKNPDVYLPDVATSLNNLGNLLSDNNEMVQAQEAYEEALLIYRQLSEKNPMTYNLDICMTAINLGLFYKDLLEREGEMSIRESGMALLKDAEKKLAIYPETHPTVINYTKYIIYLKDFFSSYSEEKHQLNHQLQAVQALEEKIKITTDFHQKVILQKQIIDTLHQIAKLLPDNPDLDNMISNEYGSYAWYLLFDKQFSAAEAAARKGLKVDSSEEWINTNLALALLYQGKYEEAKTIYQKLKNEAYGNSTYRATFLEDLDALEKEGISHSDVIKIRKFLQE